MPNPSTLGRRAFTLGAISAVAVGAGGCASTRSTIPGAASSLPSRHAWPHADLEETTIADLGARMDRGELSARSVLEGYLARIGALDQDGPSLRSVLELNPDAFAIADALDAERRAKGPRGPLHGIVFLVKDNIDTGDRMQTTAGSLALLGRPAPRDATVVQRLRAAGAIILGKTNLSEWANIRSSRSTSGFSARGGLTSNPYVLDRNPSGSSSGSAVSVSANLTTVALGTETDGSIVSPASICGIVGLKPTVGLVSRAGIIPISETQDGAGPMTRTVMDAAIVLNAIAGADARDPATLSTSSAAPPLDYTKALRPDGARGVRVGVLRPVSGSFFGIAPEVVAVFEGALEQLRRLGAVLIDPVTLPRARELEEPELEVLLTELKAGMAAYLATRATPGTETLRSIEDLVRFNTAHAKDELAWFGQDLFEKAAAKGGLDSPGYKKALATCRRLARDEGIDHAIAEHRLDVLVAPTGGPAWRTDLVNGDNVTGSTSSIAAVAGYPSITVPCGALHGLPLGISFVGAAYQEATLLRVAYAYEQATKWRRPPEYRSTVEG
jgi:amidase